MCGIAGCYQQADGRQLVDIMVDRMAHRGPDAAGVWAHTDDRLSVQLGHLRLSIIDLSASADQPFIKHGMTLIGYWSPIDPKQAEEKLVYILAYPSKAAADKSWADFSKDPEWITAMKASEKDGKLIAKVESVFLNPTDYSPIK